MIRCRVSIPVSNINQQKSSDPWCPKVKLHMKYIIAMNYLSFRKRHAVDCEVRQFWDESPP